MVRREPMVPGGFRRVTDQDRVGVYGLRLHESPGGQILTPQARSRLLGAEPDWPIWHVTWSEPSGPDPEMEEWGPDRARLRAHPRGSVELDRVGGRTTFRIPGPFAPEAFIHPYLASTAAIAGHWLGRSTFHAGAFVVDGRAWGLLGGREMGKSSTLMGLHVSGIPIVSDDVVALNGANVYSGPRCLDLRQSASKQFGAGVPLGQVGQRDRWRVRLPATSGAWPFAGWVLLGWSDDIVTEAVGAADRLRALAANRAVTAARATPPGLLDAAALPMVLFGRPHDWSCLDTGLQHLLDALTTYG